VVALTVAQALAIIYSSRAVDVVFTDMELRTQADGGTLIDAVVEKQRPGNSGALQQRTWHKPQAFPAETLSAG
jgi:hypothetical protein